MSIEKQLSEWENYLFHCDRQATLVRQQPEQAAQPAAKAKPVRLNRRRIPISTLLPAAGMAMKASYAAEIHEPTTECRPDNGLNEAQVLLWGVRIAVALMGGFSL